ncbi:MAG: helix-turn-helix transcriptional regulator [Marinoscillum sp.]
MDTAKKKLTEPKRRKAGGHAPFNNNKLSSMHKWRFLEEFTWRERDILNLMSEGLTADDIAKSLFISPHTVKTHQKNMLKKSECINSTHLVAIAVRVGYI